ncbi:helix-turn-helix domain-containing protein [Paenibacillus agilis]|uniref:Helix-turn-helix transcriptional regulator n=1 Tax=Paenibacillus agilis TaxID=3020863 RepID=A0A559J2F9_9BACL|nr:helix-turn-helix transcriptional regulator [Paenibacillus agilis]TVX94068.1 helix-turn-helix transcriptional regulator [Paenibacillus agilis]
MIDTFADIIRHRRSNLKLTMDKLAEKASVNKSIISRIENGEVKKPEINTIKSLAEALEISYDEYIRIYISLERNAEVILKILQEAISISCPASLITEISTRYLEIPHIDSYDAIENIFTTAHDINHTSTKLALFNTVVNYSREHGVMPYIAKGMYQVYMIERNDFTNLQASYHFGENILNYVDFLNPKEKVYIHYYLAVHAYSLMRFEESVKLSEYVIKNATQEEHKALSIYNICISLYQLERFIESESYLEEYKKFNFSYISDTSTMLTGILNAKIGNLELALTQLHSCLKNTSDYNIIFIISELMEVYVKLDRIEDAISLLHYESRLIVSLNDERTTPSKRRRLAYFYRQVGTILLSRDIEQSFDYFLKSASEYMKVGMGKNALESVALINEAILENDSCLTTELIKKINITFKQIIEIS